MTSGGDPRNYAVVTAAYWAFTVTDGALRMIVLLHFHTLGYSPLELATLFLLYEFCGVVTNLYAGWLGTRTGLRLTLLCGLALQVTALLGLSSLSTTWSGPAQVAFVVMAQGLSGVAKDLTKLSSKSAIKLLVPRDAEGALFRWVAFLTGSKNSLKGAGFFVGGALLAEFGFVRGLWAMTAPLLLVLLFTAVVLPRGMGRAATPLAHSRILSKSRAVNTLSLARFFLFGARDVWFAVGLPVFLYDVLHWSFVQVGTYLALWVVGYGFVQMGTPRVLELRRREPRHERDAWVGALALSVIPIVLATGLSVGDAPGSLVVVGLGVFGVVFAVNSAVHSYLILAYSDASAVSADVGFYYMANAGGRLVGTLASGLAYTYGGLIACLWVAAVMVLASAATSRSLPRTIQPLAQHPT